MPVVQLTVKNAPLRGLLFLIVLCLLCCPPAFAQTLNLPTGIIPPANIPTAVGSVLPDGSAAPLATDTSSDDDPGDVSDPTGDIDLTFDPDPSADLDPTPDLMGDWADNDGPDNDLSNANDGQQAASFALPNILSSFTLSQYANAKPIFGWPGALSTNLGWQALPQAYPTPLVQVQGAGGDDLLNQSGYPVSSIRQTTALIDWQEVDWMRGYLAANGSLPGNGNGTPGNNFFDMMNGMASFTRGTRAIAQSSAWRPLYASKIADETAVWNSVCTWLTTPAVKAVGDTYNAPYTHRSWMDAAVLRNEAYLLRLQGGTSNTAQAAVYDAIAVDYENQAIARQMGPGWMMALYPKFSDGRFRASILYNPAAGDSIPVYFDGTASNRQLHAEGVNPEKGDAGNETWDAIYNPNGDKLAVWGIGVQGPGQHRQDCSHAVDMNLLCAMQFLTSARDNTGAPIFITPDGSGRVGTLDIYGNPKKINPNAWRDIFRVQAGLAPDSKIYGGSHYASCRALFAQVFHWFDNAIRNPSASIPAPPAIPSNLYPSS